MHARNYDINMPKQNENLAVVLHGKNDLRVVSNEIKHIGCNCGNISLTGEMANAKTKTPRYEWMFIVANKVREFISEVLLKIGSVGICGSDIHMWEDGRNGKIPLTAPVVTGYKQFLSINATTIKETCLQVTKDLERL